MRATRRLLYLITYLTDFTIGLLVFAVSRQLAEGGAGLAFMGVVGGVYSFFWAASSITCGRLSDRLGRRGLISGGILLFIASGLGCALLSSYMAAKLVFYFLSGIASGMVYPPLMAWLNQGQNGAAARRQVSRTVIRFCIAWNLGLICGQFSGGIFFTLDSRLPLLVAAALSFVNFLVIQRTDGGTVLPAEAEALEIEPDAHRELSGRFARISWLANLGGAFTTGMVLHLFPDLMVELGIPPENHGAMLAVMRAAVVATYFFMHHVAFWHHRFYATLAPQFIGLGGLLLLTTATTQSGLTIGLAGFGLLLGFNYFASLYYSTTGSHDRNKGLASGIHEATLGLGVAAGSLFGGLAGVTMGPRAPYRIGMLVLVVMLLIQTYVFLRGRWSFWQSRSPR